MRASKSVTLNCRYIPHLWYMRWRKNVFTPLVYIILLKLHHATAYTNQLTNEVLSRVIASHNIIYALSMSYTFMKLYDISHVIIQLVAKTFCTWWIYPIFLCIVKNIIFCKHNIIIEHHYINNTGSTVNHAPSSAAESK